MTITANPSESSWAIAARTHRTGRTAGFSFTPPPLVIRIFPSDTDSSAIKSRILDRKVREMLAANSTPGENVSGTLVIASKNIQVAQRQNLAADENFKSAKVNLGNAMANLRELGRSYGKKAVNEFKAGFGEEIDAGLKDLGIQAENAFDVEE